MKLLKPPRKRIIGRTCNIMTKPMTGSTRRIFVELPESPTMTAVSAMEVRKIRVRKTISPSRIMPPKK